MFISIVHEYYMGICFFSFSFYREILAIIIIVMINKILILDAIRILGNFTHKKSGG